MNHACPRCNVTFWDDNAERRKDEYTHDKQTEDGDREAGQGD